AVSGRVGREGFGERDGRQGGGMSARSSASFARFYFFGFRNTPSPYSLPEYRERETKNLRGARGHAGEEVGVVFGFAQGVDQRLHRLGGVHVDEVTADG